MISLLSSFLSPVLKFFIVSLASKQFGMGAKRIGLPLITGFLFCGVVAGPFFLDLFRVEDRSILPTLNALALGFIAFAAGSELHYEKLRPKISALAVILGTMSVTLFVAGTTAFYLLSQQIDFMSALPSSTQLAAALIAGTIFLAISPSSAIAIIKELRAQGPFTQTVLGVTLLMDSIVIVAFTVASAVAVTLINQTPF